MTAGLLAVLGLGLVAAPAAAEPGATNEGWERYFDLDAKCRLDSKVLLVVKNESDKAAHYLITKKKSDGEPNGDNAVETVPNGTDGYTGEVEAESRAYVKVPYESPHDVWLLFIKKHDANGPMTDGHNGYKWVAWTKVGYLDECKKHDDKDEFSIYTVCRIDDKHIKLAIRNDSDKDEEFELRKKRHDYDGNDAVMTETDWRSGGWYDGDKTVTGVAKAGETTYVVVKSTSPDDVFILHIDKKWIKHKVGDAKPCVKPTHKPTESPSPTPSQSPTETPTETPTSPSVSPTSPPLPVTGSSTTAIAGVGLSLLGAGALALLAARRRRVL